MVMLPAIVLSLLLAAGDAVTPEETLAVDAALEEYFSSFKSIEVSYAESSEVPAEIEKLMGGPSLPTGTQHWAWQKGKHWFSIDGDPIIRQEWVFDGQRTCRTFFDNSNQIHKVVIDHSPPDKYRLDSITLSQMLGIHTELLPDGLISYWRESRRKNALTGHAIAEGLEFNLGQFDSRGVVHNIFLVIDPANDYRIVSWRQEIPEPVNVYGKLFPCIKRFAIDEFQLLTDESGGPPKWFPVEAHVDYPGGAIQRIKIQSVRLNHSIPDDRFILRDPPVGTEVHEVVTPGQPEKEYRFGGDAGDQQHLAKIAAAAKQELERLEKNGVSFDATPKESSAVPYWIAIGAVLITAAAFIAWRERRAA